MSDSRDARKLKEAVEAALAAGKLRESVRMLEQLERFENQEARWPQKLGDVYRRLEQPDRAIAAYGRAIDRLARAGFTARAIAMAKTIAMMEVGARDTLARMRRPTLSDGELAGRGLIARAQSGEPPGPAMGAEPSTKGAIEGGGNERSLRPERRDAPEQRESLELRRSLEAQKPLERREPARPDPSERAEALPLPEDPPPPRPFAARSRGTATSRRPEMASRAPATRTPATPARRPQGAAQDSKNVWDVPSRVLRQEAGAAARVPTTPAARTSARASVKSRAESPPFERAAAPRGAQESRNSAPEAPADVEYTDIELSLEDVDPDFFTVDDSQRPGAREAEEQDGEGDAEAPSEQVRYAENRALLAHNPMFAGLDTQILDSMALHSSVLRFPRGRVAIQVGSEADALYVIIRGVARVIVPGANAAAQRTLGVGAVFGEGCLLSSEPHPVQVVADEDLETMRMPKSMLSALGRAHHEVRQVLMQLLARRLLADLFKTSLLFSRLPAKARRDMVRSFELCEVPRGAVLVAAGAPGHGLYISVTTPIEVTTRDGTRRALPPGSSVGQASLVSQEPLEYGARTLEDGVVLHLSTSRFSALARPSQPAPSADKPQGDLSQTRVDESSFQSTAAEQASADDESGGDEEEASEHREEGESEEDVDSESARSEHSEGGGEDEDEDEHEHEHEHEHEDEHEHEHEDEDEERAAGEENAYAADDEQTDAEEGEEQGYEGEPTEQAYEGHDEEAVAQDPEEDDDERVHARDPDGEEEQTYGGEDEGEREDGRESYGEGANHESRGEELRDDDGGPAASAAQSHEHAPSTDRASAAESAGDDVEPNPFADLLSTANDRRVLFDPEQQTHAAKAQRQAAYGTEFRDESTLVLPVSMLPERADDEELERREQTAVSTDRAPADEPSDALEDDATLIVDGLREVTFEALGDKRRAGPGHDSPAREEE